MEDDYDQVLSILKEHDCYSISDSETKPLQCNEPRLLVNSNNTLFHSLGNHCVSSLFWIALD